MSKKIRKQWSLSLTEELETKINDYKKIYHLNENKDVLNHLLDNVLSLKPETLKLIDKISVEFNKSKNEILIPVIEKYINKTLKKEGVLKEENKHTQKSEDELLVALRNIVNDFEKQPIEKRKFICPTFVYKYLMFNSDKYKQKNYSVIKRVLSGYTKRDISFIKEYHKENNLSVKSNLKASNT